MHRRTGFSNETLAAYQEYLAVMQAVFIMQDAIKEMHYALTGSKELPRDWIGQGWREARDLRNLTVGHPTRKSHGETEVRRSVIGREIKTYERVSFSSYQASGPKREYVNLGNNLDKFYQEAEIIMRRLLAEFRNYVSDPEE